MDEKRINKLVVVGIGLIGGSVASGLKQCGACSEIIGVARDADVCEEAVARGIVDRAYTRIADVASELTEQDVIFVAVPTLSVKSVFEDIKRHVVASPIITDGASVKGSVEQAAIEVFGKVPPRMVLGHPIAGSEKSGVTAANPTLYQRHRVILTPMVDTEQAALDTVSWLWKTLGAEVLTMTVEEHDDVLGATSHLPHVIAYSLVDTLAVDIQNPNIFRYAAGGFRDFTRIASSDPRMWHDIMKANKNSVLKSMDLFIDNLTRLRSSIEQEDGDYLLEVFSRAKRARDEYTQLIEAAKSDKV
jgi:cyclohexadieny/prephenate dehydrogenase